MSLRRLEPGTEVSITGEKGRFRFVNESITSTDKVVYNFVGGIDGHECFRSFYPSKIKRVHRIPKTRERANRKGK